MTRRSTKNGGRGGDHKGGYGKPPVSGRFQKGRSGNPNGRPRKTPVVAPSPFNLVFAQTMLINREGKRYEATPEEALLQALVQQALAGDRTAIRRVLKLIQARQAAIVRATPEQRGGELLVEVGDPPNANEALLILGIGGYDSSWSGVRLSLLPWAVKAAFKRYRGPPLKRSDLSLAHSSTIDPDQVRWPTEPAP
jgi:hypothetical protein